MCAELVPDESTQSQNNSFTLQVKFSDRHQINLVVEDKQKQQAIFVTQSYQNNNSPT